MNHIYRLSHTWYEEDNYRFFTGPECNFQELCESLLDKAVDRAIIKRESEKYVSWIGWGTITDMIAELLQEVGYQEVIIDSAEFWGSCIIDSEYDKERLSDEQLNKIVTHNQKVRGGL